MAERRRNWRAISKNACRNIFRSRSLPSWFPVLPGLHRQIRVIGQAAKPQALPYRQNMSLLDVMIAVGITDFADGNHASILRMHGGRQQFTVRLEDLVRGGNLAANVEMRPGDILIIPESWF